RLAWLRGPAGSSTGMPARPCPSSGQVQACRRRIPAPVSWASSAAQRTAAIAALVSSYPTRMLRADGSMSRTSPCDRAVASGYAVVTRSVQVVELLVEAVVSAPGPAQAEGAGPEARLADLEAVAVVEPQGGDRLPGVRAPVALAVQGAARAAELDLEQHVVRGSGDGEHAARDVGGAGVHLDPVGEGGDLARVEAPVEQELDP